MCEPEQVNASIWVMKWELSSEQIYNYYSHPSINNPLLLLSVACEPGGILHFTIIPIHWCISYVMSGSFPASNVTHSWLRWCLWWGKPAGMCEVTQHKELNVWGESCGIIQKVPNITVFLRGGIMPEHLNDFQIKAEYFSAINVTFNFKARPGCSLCLIHHLRSRKHTNHPLKAFLCYIRHILIRNTSW